MIGFFYQAHSVSNPLLTMCLKGNFLVTFRSTDRKPRPIQLEDSKTPYKTCLLQ